MSESSETHSSQVAVDVQCCMWLTLGLVWSGVVWCVSVPNLRSQRQRSSKL